MVSPVLMVAWVSEGCEAYCSYKLCLKIQARTEQNWHFFWNNPLCSFGYLFLKSLPSKIICFSEWL